MVDSIPQRKLMRRRLFIIQTLSVLAAASGSISTGAISRSFASSIEGHRVLDFDLLDASRQRPVPMRLYLPERASQTHPVPLLTFSHGLGGSRFGYRYLGSHLADAGIASLHPQHIGSDNALWWGNPFELVQRLQSAVGDSEARSRVLDIRFSLDKIFSSEVSPLLDPSKIAVAGHSYGANTAMLISGAQVKATELNAGSLRDQRIRAAILISAPPLVGQGSMEEVLGAVSVPTLHITSVDDTINLPGYRSTVEDRLVVFNAMSESQKTLAVFNTGGHSIFTDRTTRSGPEISARIKNATRELSTIFLRESFFEELEETKEQGLGEQAPFDRITSSEQSTKEWLVKHNDLVYRFVTPFESQKSG